MQILNNLASIFGLGNLNKNKKKQSESMEKLATGEAFPSARYGAETYAISEKMRVQIRALDQNDDNVKAGGDLLRTAEGALQSQLNIMRQIKEKVIDAANDTNTDQDRVTIQKEIDQLCQQIDNIANSTRYNGHQLLVGSAEYVYYHEWVNYGEPVQVIGSDLLDIIPNVHYGLDGYDDYFDVFQPSGIYNAAITNLSDVSKSYTGGLTTYSVTVNSLEDLKNRGLQVGSTAVTSAGTATYIFTYGGAFGEDENTAETKFVDLNDCSSVQDAFNKLKSLAGNSLRDFTLNGNTMTTSTYIEGYEKNSRPISPVPVPGASNTGVFAGNFSDGSDPIIGDDQDIPTIEEVKAKFKASIASVNEGSGFRLYSRPKPESKPDFEIVFTAGDSEPAQVSSNRYEVGLNWSGEVEIENFTFEIDSSKNLTITSPANGIWGNQAYVKDGIPDIPAGTGSTTAVSKLDVDVIETLATAEISLENLNTTDPDTLETFISEISGNYFNWQQGGVKFIDSQHPVTPEDESVVRHNYPEFDLDVLRSDVAAGKTIANAFAERLDSYDTNGRIDINYEGSAAKSLIFKAPIIGNYHGSVVIGKERYYHYDIDFKTWFESHRQELTEDPDEDLPSKLNGKAFRAYCATDSDQWFNFIFRSGDNSERTDSGNPDEFDYRSIDINVSEITDAKSLVLAIYNQAHDKLIELNHYMRAAVDPENGILTLYDTRYPFQSGLYRSLGIYQQDGAKITDGAADNIIKIEKNFHSKRFVIQDTEKSNSYISLKVPQTSLDHIFYAIPEPLTIRDYPVTSERAIDELLGKGRDKYARNPAGTSRCGIIDRGINYILDAMTEVGAQMQRLELSNSNIVTKRENAQASESTIRNIDMAKEMIEQTKLNILANASQAMLAQSNQNLSNVLELIQ